MALQIDPVHITSGGAERASNSVPTGSRHEENAMKMALLPTFLAAALVVSGSLSGCAGMSDTQQRTLSGAAIGTAGGALIGGSDGALIGAGVGALSGYLFDQHKKSKGE